VFQIHVYLHYCCYVFQVFPPHYSCASFCVVIVVPSLCDFRTYIAFLLFTFCKLKLRVFLLTITNIFLWGKFFSHFFCVF
jgi:hypothetical protein